MRSYQSCPIGFWLARLIAILAIGLGCSTLQAQFGPPGGGAKVTYNPDTTQLQQGFQPYSAWFDLSITAPANLAAGLWNIDMELVVTQSPGGVSLETAASYIRFADPVTGAPKNQLIFTGPNQKHTVRVLTGIPYGSSEGMFSYRVTTAGWPTWAVNEGMEINAQAAIPSGVGGPTVLILAPADGTEYTYTVGGPAVPVAIQVQGIANPSATVSSLVASLRGEDADGNVVLPETPLDLVLTALGEPDAYGNVIFPVSQGGVYTITATATNAIGSDTTSSTFVVVQQVPPPTVVIDPPVNNPTYTYVRGVTSASVPYSFTGTTLLGNIIELTATLDGVPFVADSLVGVGEAASATGSGVFTFDANTVGGPGQHTIQVTAKSEYGEATTSATFVVAEVVPTISIDITAPIDGTSLVQPPDASPLNLPYQFVANTTLGANVTGLTATLTKDGVTSPLSIGTIQDLNTPQATGGGSFSNLQPGTYTLTATATNVAFGLSTTDSVTFTVLPPPPPAIVFTEAPAASYTALRGQTLSIPFAIQTSSLGAYITVQTVTLNGQSVGFNSTANGTTLVATGTGSLSIAASTTGSSAYTLVATGTDTYGRTVSTQTQFTVVVNEPAIAISINPEIAANSPYSLPSSGVLAIPFTFTGTITTGATVDTIVGTINGANVSISNTNGLGTSSVATVSGTLVITEPGTYVVTATDTNTASGLSATTSVTFEVEASSQPGRIDGLLFFDVNFNGVREAGEYGLPGITVKLLSANGATVATTVSDANGAYSFEPAPGNYIVSAGQRSGLSFTTLADHAVTLSSSNRVVPDIGYGLHFAAINGKVADGKTIGFWKNNIDKALSGKTNGVQVSAQTLAAYTAVVGQLALEPFTNLTMKQAVDAMSANGSDPKVLLTKQLVASEYNYASGAYIGGDETLTYAFIYFAEYVLKNANNYTKDYILFVKDWCDAYNNSHGGKISGPKS